MFENLVINALTGHIEGLPDDWEVILLANICGELGAYMFFAIICPINSPLDASHFRASIIQAKTLLFRHGGIVILGDITCGQKIDDTEFIVSWRRNHDPWYFRKFAGAYSFAGIPIRPEKILISRL